MGKDYMHVSKVTRHQWCTLATAQTTHSEQIIQRCVRDQYCVCACVCVFGCVLVCVRGGVGLE